MSRVRARNVVGGTFIDIFIRRFQLKIDQILINLLFPVIKITGN